MDLNQLEKLVSQMPVGYALFKLDYENSNLIHINVVQANDAFLKAIDIKLNDSLLNLKQNHLDQTALDSLIKIIVNSPVMNHTCHVEPNYYKLNSNKVNDDHVAVFIIDITKEILEAKDNLTLLSAVSDIIFELDENSVFTNVYAHDESKLFFPRSQIIGSNFNTLFPSELAEKLSKSRELSRITQTKQFLTYPSIVEGDNRWFRAESSYIKTSQGSRFLVTVADITKEKDLQDELDSKTNQIERFFNVNTGLLSIVNSEGKFVKLSQSWEAMSGYSLDELIGRNFIDFVHPDDHEMTVAEASKLIDNGSSNVFINRYVTKSNDIRSIEWHTQVDNLFYFSSALDVTDEKRLKEDLLSSNERFLSLSRFGRIFSWEVDVQGMYTYVNDVCYDILGYAPDEMINALHFYDLHPALGRETFKETSFAAFKKKESINSYKNSIETKTGELVWVLTSARPLLDNSDTLIGYRGFDIDITNLQNIEEALKTSQEQIEMLTMSMTDVLWLYNYDQKRFEYFSPSVQLQLGFTVEEALQKNIEDFMTSDSASFAVKVLDEAVDKFKLDPNVLLDYSNELQMLCKDGSTLWIETSSRFRYNHKDEIEIVGVSRDIEDRKKYEQEILYLSYHDQLTGLYNRRYYEIEFERLNTTRNLPISLIMCDVNGLKLANDAFGHLEGDKLLNQFAKILKSVSRADDIIARIGGDEFVILLPKSDIQVAEGIVRRLTNSISALIPETIKLSVSFGIASTAVLLSSDNELFREAENAMYKEKIVSGDDYKSELLQLITESLYAKYPDQKRHSERVSQLSYQIAVAYGLNASELDDASIAGLLHDIGKIGPNYSKEETDEVINHPVVGYQILRSIPQFQHLADYILYHHEAMDGTGYPKGLKGSKIPLIARIVKIANEYDMLVSVHKYPSEKALELMNKDAGALYDADLLKAFEIVLETPN